MAASQTVRAEDLRAYVHAVCRALGADAEIAAEVASHLVKANLSGHDSHGVLRLPQYVEQADRGGLIPNARIEVLRAVGGAALADAHFGFGQFSTMQALEWAMARAIAHGVSAVALRHATHIGRLGEYTERASAAGMIALVTIGTLAPGMGGVVPLGGRDRLLGTNPWSIGVPADGPVNMVYDAATSVMAEGKLRVARAKGAALPEGVIVDKEGHPSTDPLDYYDGGALLTVGGAVAAHKGYGLSMASALIAGLSMINDDTARFPVPSAGPASAAERGRIGGVFLIVIDPAAFGDPAEYAKLTGEALDATKRGPTAPGVDEILIPGEPESRSRAERSARGIAIPQPIWDDLAALATRFSVPLPQAD